MLCTSVNYNFPMDEGASVMHPDCHAPQHQQMTLREYLWQRLPPAHPGCCAWRCHLCMAAIRRANLSCGLFAALPVVATPKVPCRRAEVAEHFLLQAATSVLHQMLAMSMAITTQRMMHPWGAGDHGCQGILISLLEVRMVHAWGWVA